MKIRNEIVENQRGQYLIVGRRKNNLKINNDPPVTDSQFSPRRKSSSTEGSKQKMLNFIQSFFPGIFSTEDIHRRISRELNHSHILYSIFDTKQTNS